MNQIHNRTLDIIRIDCSVSDGTIDKHTVSDEKKV